MPIYIALDTSAIEVEAFDFGRSHALLALPKAVADQEVEVLLVDVVDREVRKHLRQRAEVTTTGLRKTLSRLSKPSPEDATLDTSKVVAEFEKLQLDNLATMREAEWTAYVAQLRATTLAARDVDSQRVLDAYFDVRPPFSKDKPKEFPDAFVVERLRQWAEEKQATVYVVSTDEDMKSCCDGVRLVAITRISEALDEAMRLARDKTRSREAIHAFCNAHTQEIDEQLADQLPDQSFVVEQDVEADVEDVSFVAASKHKFNVIEIDEAVEVEGSADVEFTVDAEVADYDNSPHDAGEYVFLLRNTVRIRATRTIRFTLSIELDENGSPVSVDSESIQIFEPDTFEIGDEHDEQEIIRGWGDGDGDGDE
jgi:hypothetical protein